MVLSIGHGAAVRVVPEQVLGDLTISLLQARCGIDTEAS